MHSQIHCLIETHCQWFGDNHFDNLQKMNYSSLVCHLWGVAKSRKIEKSEEKAPRFMCLDYAC